MGDTMNENQPEPKPGTVGVVDWIIDQYGIAKEPDGTLWARIRDLLIERRVFGIKKYGCPLEAHNGLDPVKMLEEEAVDGFQYSEQADIECRRIPRAQAESMVEMLEQTITNIHRMMED